MELPAEMKQYLSALDENTVRGLLAVPLSLWTFGTGVREGPHGLMQCLTSHVYRLSPVLEAPSGAVRVAALFDRTCGLHGLAQTVEAVKSFLRNLK